MPHQRKPLVSIIISTRNEQVTLPWLLKSLTKQSYSALEIIVVDNHSTDQTVRIAKRVTRLVFSWGNERSTQRNFGAKKAQGTYILFLDADMVLPSSVLKECVIAVTANDAVGVVIPEDVEVTNFYSRIKRLEKRMYWHEPLIEAARFFKKSVFIKLGGYDESLVAGEDWDISQRATQLGSIVRSKIPLFHNNLSLFRELKHKYYYAHHMKTYARIHPKTFKQQRGQARIHLFFRKINLFLEDPLAFVALVTIKGIELLFYLIIPIIKHTDN